MKFRKKPVVIEAFQWFKNGDHPQDHATEMFDYPDGQRPRAIREGVVVRYSRRPDVPGDSLCEQCGKPHHVHGWIDTLEQGHRVCPGDWIITGVKGERYPCKPDIFAATYDPEPEWIHWTDPRRPRPGTQVRVSFEDGTEGTAVYTGGPRWESVTPEGKTPIAWAPQQEVAS